MYGRFNNAISKMFAIKDIHQSFYVLILPAFCMNRGPECPHTDELIQGPDAHSYSAHELESKASELQLKVISPQV
jgi:hypothetical protein